MIFTGEKSHQKVWGINRKVFHWITKARVTLLNVEYKAVK